MLQFKRTLVIMLTRTRLTYGSVREEHQVDTRSLDRKMYVIAPCLRIRPCLICLVVGTAFSVTSEVPNHAKHG